MLERLLRALDRAADFINDPANRRRGRGATGRAQSDRCRTGVHSRHLNGRMQMAPDGSSRVCADYIVIGRDGAARPEPAQAAWLYAQMVRWNQAALSPDRSPPPRRVSVPTSMMRLSATARARVAA